MKNSANGNIYEATLRETWSLFSAFLSGEETSVACVIHGEPLSTQACSALKSAMTSLDYGRKPCTFVSLTGTASAEAAPAEPALDGSALFLLLEGLDPFAIIAADATAAATLGAAYRHEVGLDEASRLLGRNVVAFTSFESQLKSAQSKQVAWALLKKLPAFPRQ